jgi:hypothetical protein
MGRSFSLPSWLPRKRAKAKKPRRDVLARRPQGLMKRTKRPRHALRATLWILGILLFLGGAAYGIREYLLRSPAYQIRYVNLNGEIIEASEKKLNASSHCKLMGLRRGTSIFRLDLADIRRRLLKISTISDARISRQLPDTLVVETYERTPIARLGRTNLAIDRDGVVFTIDNRPRALPIVTGYQFFGKGIPLADGDRVDGRLAMAAIELLSYCGNGKDLLPISSIDIACEDYLLCIMKDNRQARLAWEGMGTFSEESAHNLARRVHELVSAMNSPRAQAYRIFHALPQ